MAANSLLDRGWGKATQLVDVQGEVRQLVEVKLSVVQAAPAALPGALSRSPSSMTPLTRCLPSPALMKTIQGISIV
jgi:hypothetical protein